MTDQIAPFDLPTYSAGWDVPLEAKLGEIIDAVNDHSSALDGAGGGGGSLAAHIASETPHPAYDVEMEDLVGLLDNRLA